MLLFRSPFFCVLLRLISCRVIFLLPQPGIASYGTSNVSCFPMESVRSGLPCDDHPLTHTANSSVVFAWQGVEWRLRQPTRRRALLLGLHKFSHRWTDTKE